MAPKTRDSRFQVKLGDVLPLHNVATQPKPPSAIQRSDFPPRFADVSQATQEQVSAFLDELIEYSTIEPFFVRMTVGAAFAQECLRRSKGNPRGEDYANTAASMARDMLAGAWDETLEPWKFTVSGRYADAHTRAHALVEANRIQPVTATIAVGFGAPDSAVRNMGSSKPWSAGKVLQIPGAVKQAVVAACMWMNNGNRQSLTIRELDDVYTRFVPVLEGIGGISTRYPAPVWGVLLALYTRHPKQITEFARQLKLPAGEQAQAHKSVNQLREWLLRYRAQMAGTGGDSTARQRALKTMTAVRVFMDQRDVGKLLVKKEQDGDNSLYAWFKSNAAMPGEG